MFDMDDLATVIGIWLVGGCMLVIGIMIAMPNELENGCIIHDGKVYCEEVNKEDN